jgi:hypothetical protein
MKDYMTYNNLFELELLKLVEAEIELAIEKLTHPAAIIDFADYKYHLGKIAAYRAINDLCGEVNSIISKR